MERSLEGRTALVTGSTSGIGRGIALAFAQAGAKILLHGLGAPGQVDQGWPSHGSTFEAQTPQPSSRISTSPGPGSGRGTSATENLCGPSRTAARMVWVIGNRP